MADQTTVAVSGTRHITPAKVTLLVPRFVVTSTHKKRRPKGRLLNVLVPVPVSMIGAINSYYVYVFATWAEEAQRSFAAS
jgi:hypothetical protein